MAKRRTMLKGVVMTVEKRKKASPGKGMHTDHWSWKEKAIFGIASARDTAIGYAGLVILELYVIFGSVSTIHTVFNLTYDQTTLSIVLLYIVVLFQEVPLRILRRSKEYTLFLADEAALNKGGKDSGFSYNLQLLRIHLRALRRYADDRTARSFEDLTLGILRSQGIWIPDDLNLKQMFFSLTLGMAEKSSKLPATQHGAFNDYKLGIRRVLDVEPVIFSDVGAFLVSEYVSMPAGLRWQSERSRGRGLMRRFEGHVTLAQMFIASIELASVVALAIYFH